MGLLLLFGYAILVECIVPQIACCFLFRFLKKIIVLLIMNSTKIILVIMDNDEKQEKQKKVVQSTFSLDPAYWTLSATNNAHAFSTTKKKDNCLSPVSACCSPTDACFHTIGTEFSVTQRVRWHCILSFNLPHKSVSFFYLILCIWHSLQITEYKYIQYKQGCVS